MYKNNLVILGVISTLLFLYFCEKSATLTEPSALPEPLLSPKSLKVLTESTSSLNISWDSVATASHYSILRSRKYDEDYMIVDSVKTNYYLDKDLPEGILYFYKIAAKNANESKESKPAWGVPCDASKDSIYAIFDGYNVTGRVFYHDSLEDKRIVWWVKTDIWYIQPYENNYYTRLDSQGCFRRWGHYGKKAHIILTKPNGNLPVWVWPGSSSWGVTPLLEIYVDKE